jgi:hypothetical protein
VIIYGFMTFSVTKIIPNSDISEQDTGVGLSLFGLQFILLILLFLQVTAGHWVFLPSAVHSIIQGMAWFYLVLISGIIGILALLEVRI